MKSFVDFSENLEDRKKQLMQKQRVMQQMEREKASRTNQQFKQDVEDKKSRADAEKEEEKRREELKKEIKQELKKEMDEELNQDDKPFVKKLVGKLRKGSKTHAKQADDLEKAMKEETTKADLYKAYRKGMKMVSGTPAFKAHQEKISKMRKD